MTNVVKFTRMRCFNVLKKFSVLFIFITFFSFAQNADAGEEANIAACVKAIEDYSNRKVENSPAYESNILSPSTANWPDIHCEVKFGSVYNLSVYGIEYVVEGFAGKHAKELYTVLENHIEEAISILKNRIPSLKNNLKQAKIELQMPNPDLISIERQTKAEIKAATGNEISIVQDGVQLQVIESEKNDYGNVEFDSLEKKLRQKIDNLLFLEGKEILMELKSHELWNDEESDQFENYVIEKVKPIPASKIDQNRDGYFLLLVLSPDNESYLAKYHKYRELAEKTEILASSNPQNIKWVAKQGQALVYSCPSKNCGIVGWLNFRDNVMILEESKGWSRITKYYRVLCANGKILYDIDSGNSKCSEANGVIDGKIARWIQESELSGKQPEDPAKTAKGYEIIIKDSDDFGIYRTQFSKAAKKLIEQGKCTKNDFREIGGWLKSSEKGKYVYFTYCGGFTIQNRLYLDVVTGNVFE